MGGTISAANRTDHSGAIITIALPVPVGAPHVGQQLLGVLVDQLAVQRLLDVRVALAEARQAIEDAVQAKQVADAAIAIAETVK